MTPKWFKITANSVTQGNSFFLKNQARYILTLQVLFHHFIGQVTILFFSIFFILFCCLFLKLPLLHNYFQTWVDEIFASLPSYLG